MKTKVYIDGQAGTTGLQIYERIGKREDLELLRIDEEKRHDLDERKKFLNMADIVFLCLPDAGAIEAVSLIENPDVRVIDASTAHRTNDEWDYGFPELSKAQRDKIAVSKRVAQKKFPGSEVAGHANTFIFPDINAGNIGYKIAQRIGNFEAFGPILLGLNSPINDLSRGCTAQEVYSMAIITAAFAASEKKNK